MIKFIKTSIIPDIDRYHDLYPDVESARHYGGKVAIMALRSSNVPVEPVLIFGAPEFKTRVTDVIYSVVRHISTSAQTVAILTDLHPEETIELTVVKSRNVLSSEEIYPFILRKWGYYLVYKKWNNGISEDHITINNEPNDLNKTFDFCYYFCSKYSANLDHKVKFMEYDKVPKYLKKLESI
jgi:hypothetical protein